MDREESPRPAVWQTRSSWMCALRVRDLRWRPLEAATGEASSGDPIDLADARALQIASFAGGITQIR